jgi:ATP-dependent RNA helicase DHX8/PRP22
MNQPIATTTDDDAGIENDFEVLPLSESKSLVLDALRVNQILICVSETGSGKTTQIPQFCLDNGFLGERGMMAITQPRRVAAISVAQRVSEERHGRLGDEIGYSVRFDDKTSSRTRIKFMTDGVLLRECLSDSSLSRYSVIMLDEAHERSINTDILFGLIKAAYRQRRDLKVIITSATLNIDKFSQYFNYCPVIRIPGRMFPVDIYHSKTKQIMVCL